MEEIAFLQSEISKRYGKIKRARGCFLYTESGIRLTDLYLEGGRAILGWGGSQAFSDFKNVLSRGLTGSFNTIYLYRLKKAISDLLNDDFFVDVFLSKEIALKLANTFFPNNFVVWKPWIPYNNLKMKSALILEPPLAWGTPFCFLLHKSDELKNNSSFLGQTTFVPPALEAAFCRSLYDLKNAILVRKEKDWFVFDKIIKDYWIRKGPYLYPKENIVCESDWKSFVQHCLDCCIVVNPCYSEPSIVPCGAEISVFKKLIKNPFSSAEK